MKQSNAAWAKVVALVKSECANYDTATGDCLYLDYPCPQLRSPLTCRERGKLVCRYFDQNVLPLDRLLQASIHGGVELKKCKICGRTMEATGNRAKYCPECREQQRKKSEAARLRRARAEQKGYTVRI